MKKFIVFILVVGALSFAYKHWQKKRQPTALEVTAEQAGKYVATGTYDPKVIAEARAKEGHTADQSKLASLLASAERLVRSHDPETSTDPVERARLRAESLAKYWKAGGVSLSDDEVKAGFMWARGTLRLSQEDNPTVIADAFDRWRREKGLYREIGKIEVGQVTRTFSPERGDYTIVELWIDRERFRVGVPDSHNPLFWLD